MDNNNLMNQFSGFMQNPMEFLIQRKINIPSQFQNDPHGAVQYLMNSGKMSQEQFNRLYQTAQQLGVKL